MNVHGPKQYHSVQSRKSFPSKMLPTFPNPSVSQQSGRKLKVKIGASYLYFVHPSCYLLKVLLSLQPEQVSDMFWDVGESAVFV